MLKPHITNTIPSVERFHQIRSQFPDILFVIARQMGKIVGCSREMAGRVLKNLEEEGLVSVSGKTMVVLGTR